MRWPQLLAVTYLYRKRTQRALCARCAGVVRALCAPARVGSIPKYGKLAPARARAPRGRKRVGCAPHAGHRARRCADVGGAKGGRSRHRPRGAAAQHSGAAAQRGRWWEQGGASPAGLRDAGGRMGGGYPFRVAETPLRSTTGAQTGAAGLKTHCRTTLRHGRSNEVWRGVYKCKQQQVYKRKGRRACAYRCVKRCIYIRKRGAAAGHAGAGGQGGTPDTASSRPGRSGATHLVGAHGGQHSGGGRAPRHPCTCGHGGCTPFTLTYKSLPRHPRCCTSCRAIAL